MQSVKGRAAGNGSRVSGPHVDTAGSNCSRGLHRLDVAVHKEHIRRAQVTSKTPHSRAGTDSLNISMVPDTIVFDHHDRLRGSFNGGQRRGPERIGIAPVRHVHWARI